MKAWRSNGHWKISSEGEVRSRLGASVGVEPLPPGRTRNPSWLLPADPPGRGWTSAGRPEGRVPWQIPPETDGPPTESHRSAEPGCHRAGLQNGTGANRAPFPGGTTRARLEPLVRSPGVRQARGLPGSRVARGGVRIAAREGVPGHSAAHPVTAGETTALHLCVAGRLGSHLRLWPPARIKHRGCCRDIPSLERLPYGNPAASLLKVSGRDLEAGQAKLLAPHFDHAIPVV